MLRVVDDGAERRSRLCLRRSHPNSRKQQGQRNDDNSNLLILPLFLTPYISFVIMPVLHDYHSE